jgi:hypothetical protein
MDLDAFREEAAAMASRQGLPGQILKFNKDAGWADKDSDMNGAKPVVLIKDSMKGWTLWQDAKPTDYIMGLVRDRFQPPPRDMLGHTDESRWKYGQDPWQFTYALPMVDNDGSLYCFTTSSAGGKDCVAGLIRAYAEHEEKRGADPRTLPVVSLERDSYKNKHGGVVAIPDFSIVRWTEPPPNLALIVPPSSSSGTLLDGKLIEHNPTERGAPKLVESKPQDRTAFERKPFARDEIDDDIPF